MKTTCWKWSYFWGEKKRSTSKKLGCKFVRINISKENYDPDYEVSRIQTFISESKDRKFKKIRKRIKQKNKRTRKWNKKNQNFNWQVKPLNKNKVFKTVFQKNTTHNHKAWKTQNQE